MLVESVIRKDEEEEMEERELDSSSSSAASSIEEQNQQDYCKKSVSVTQNEAKELNDDGQESRFKSQINKPIELRLLVRRREAGALIGKRGSNIKRMRETYRETSSFSIPDTGNGPERVVCIVSRCWTQSMEAILSDVTRLLLEKNQSNSAMNEQHEQIELKMLIHSLHAGSIIGLAGQSIKKLRVDSKAAIKIFEMSCPYSNERVCAIKSRPSTVVNAVKMILDILDKNPLGKQHTYKPYDALNFDLSLAHKYGGYLPVEEMLLPSHSNGTALFTAQSHLGSCPRIGLQENSIDTLDHYKQRRLQMGTQTITGRPLKQFAIQHSQRPSGLAGSSQMGSGHHQTSSFCSSMPITRFHPYKLNVTAATTASQHQHQQQQQLMMAQLNAINQQLSAYQQQQQQTQQVPMAMPHYQQQPDATLLAALAAAACFGQQSIASLANPVAPTSTSNNTNQVTHLNSCPCAGVSMQHHQHHQTFQVSNNDDATTSNSIRRFVQEEPRQQSVGTASSVDSSNSATPKLN